MIKKDLNKINNEITSKEVRLVGDNVNSDVYSIEEALKIAYKMGLDLIEINPKVYPSICKIEDYKKYLYDLKKKKKEQDKRNKQNISEIKEIRFTPNTDKHDFEFKLKHAKSFLSDGDKVRAFVFFRGREIVYKEKGELILLELANKLEEIGSVESLPKLEGNKMFIIIKPKK